MKSMLLTILLLLLQNILANKEQKFLNESCRLLREMFKDSEQYQRKIYKINLNDKEGLIKLLIEAEEIFYDLTYPKILKKVHNFSKLYDERVRTIIEHFGVSFGLYRRNWDLFILKFIALTSKSQNEDEQVCLLHSQTSMLIYTLFSTNVFYSNKLDYQKFLMQYFLRYLSGEYDYMEKYDFYTQNFNQGIGGIYVKTQRQIQKLYNSLKKFEGKQPTPAQLSQINAALDKGEAYLNKTFNKIIKVAVQEIQEEFFGTFQFYKDIVKKQQNLKYASEENPTNRRASLKNSNLVKDFENFQIFEVMEFPLEVNQQDNFIDYFQKMIDTAIVYGDYIIKKVKINSSDNMMTKKINNQQLIIYEQQLFDLLLKKDYENHLKDYQFQQVHNQAMVNIQKRNVTMAYKSLLGWKLHIQELREQFNKKGRVLMFRNYEMEQIYFNLSNLIGKFFGFNQNPSQWSKDLMYDEDAIKNNNMTDEDILKYFIQRRDNVVDQQKKLKHRLNLYSKVQNLPHYFKTFLFYNQRILTNKPLSEIIEIQRDILDEQKRSNKQKALQISSVLIENYTESFFFLSKISKQIKNENPKTIIRQVLHKLHKAGSLIEFSAETILSKIFTFLDDALFQIITGALKNLILDAVQNYCRENGEQVPQNFSEINLMQRVDAWLLPVTKWFRENEIIDDEVLQEVEEYQKTMHDKLHKRLLRFRIENFDYDKRYFESNDKMFNDLIVSNFLTEKLQHKKTEKPHFNIQIICDLYQQKYIFYNVRFNSKKSEKYRLKIYNEF